jgi:hypothetical protein
MKIIKIEITDGKVMCFPSKNIKLPTVKLTLKSFLGKTKVITAYPTNVGPTYGAKSILYFYYCDEVGKNLSDEFSRQINNYVETQSLELEKFIR